MVTATRFHSKDYSLPPALISTYKIYGVAYKLDTRCHACHIRDRKKQLLIILQAYYKEVSMATNMEHTVVNSWNEWDPLKHVIVGRADGTMVQAPEPAVRRDWP